jgi:hypothetical protein
LIWYPSNDGWKRTVLARDPDISTR